MKKHSSNTYKEIEDFFLEAPDAEEKAWGMIHDFYHLVLTEMENKKIKRADIARKLDISAAAVSKLLNKTPNLTIIKMVELADSVGLDLELKRVKQESADKKAAIHYNWLMHSVETIEINSNSDYFKTKADKHLYEQIKIQPMSVNDCSLRYGG